MIISKTSIYFFSGTGNALKTSEWASKVAENMGIAVNLISVDRMPTPLNPVNSINELIGFVFPTHGFNLPWYMLKFIWKFPKGKNTGFFIMNTRAGMKISKYIFMPGLSGIAWILPVLILMLKGYKWKGLMSVDLPSNWISLHPGLRPVVVDSITMRCEKKVKKFTEKLFTKGRSFHFKVFISLPIDLAIIPVSFIYLIYARFFLSKTFIAATNCNNCRLCEEICPVNAIQIKHNRPYWTLHCESCMRCMNICPQKAIQTSHSFAAIMVAITAFIPLSYYFTMYLQSIFGFQSFIFQGFAFIFSLPVYVFIFFILYKILFYFTQIPWINNLFSFTSFTRVWRRYIAKDVKISSFKKYRFQ